MIGFFPDPYPDELLYSVCARYTKITQYPNKMNAVKELFGKKGLAAVVDFPNRLDYLISVLPRNHNYSVESFIELNSLIPFYAPFLPEGRIEKIYMDMKGDDNNRLQAKLLSKGTQIKSLNYLRYCPKCMKEDLIKYEETYWHRSHQLNGIPICSVHQCFLENSLVKFGRSSSTFFHDANDYISKSTNSVSYLELNRKSHQILLKIARDAEWLLANPQIQLNSKILRDRYYNILLSRGFAYYNGHIKRMEFLKDCNDFFPREIFDYVGKFSKKDEWLSALLESGYTKTACHPIRHLLLLTFLGFTVQEFFTTFTEFKPFFDPPYPCLNKASDHYGELRIDSCKLFDAVTKKKTFHQPRAVFECDCGFTYQRFGPDKSESDKFKFSSVREYGQIWEDKLIELWADPVISTDEIGKQIGVTKWTVNRHAIRLALPMNAEGTRSVKGYDRHHNPKATFSERKIEYRNKWLALRKNRNDATRKELLNSQNFLYLWLKKNDSEWFENHLPKRIKISLRRSFLNWEKIDNQLSKETRKICSKILAIKGSPVRISITEVIRRVGKAKWIDKRHQNLPLTTEVLDKYLESWEDFVLRRVAYGKELFIQKGILPTLKQFIVESKMEGNDLSKYPKVQEAIQEALAEIKYILNLN